MTSVLSIIGLQYLFQRVRMVITEHNVFQCAQSAKYVIKFWDFVQVQFFFLSCLKTFELFLYINLLDL